MPISLEKFLKTVADAHSGQLPLNEEQQKAINHNYTQPLWIVAGPGTGKTHTLVWLALKRVLVDGVPPNRLFLTTFTRKAAAELESRLIIAQQKLADIGLTEASKVEFTSAYIGTLHGLANKVLMDEHYEKTLHIRMLEDELTQQFFLRRRRNPLLDIEELGFWQFFNMLEPSAPYPPNRAKRAENTAKIFNRLTENSITPEILRSSENAYLIQVAGAYEEYKNTLQLQHRIDQAHLQQYFLDYLETQQGMLWLDKGFTVIVDEYQDTNPIQEKIYFKLTGDTRDLTVVGDDDQSLYRFRGASVESLINFDLTCKAYLNGEPEPIYLHENRRSHPKIVKFVNQFINNHVEMKDSDPAIRVRAPNKPELTVKSDITGNYPAVCAIARSGSHRVIGDRVVDIIRDIKDNGLVEDYSQIAILSFSTRETTHGISAYVDALRENNIPYYNPRNRTAHTDNRVRTLIGGLCYIIDPDSITLPANLPRGVPDYLNHSRTQFQDFLSQGDYPDLVKYVNSSIDAIRNAQFNPNDEPNFLKRKGGRRVTLSGILYKLLGLEPFSTDLTTSDGGERIKALNIILSEYEALYSNGELRLQQRDNGQSYIDSWAIYNFYSVFIEGIHDGLNDPEDEEISIQRGMVNIMTIHQAKGLEFDVVFVLRPDKQPWLSDTHTLEDLLEPYTERQTGSNINRRSQELRVAEDTIRLFFVAYSRAKRLLIISGVINGNNANKWNRPLGYPENSAGISNRSDLSKLGIHLL